ncbi:MAG TPA: cysteine--tRNA ligase [Bdellovibrionota bacterium]|nr:cysteine--tRNA ligase [Bdellovibrionota bacterium]
MSKALPEIWLTDTLKGKKVRLETKVPGKLSFYSCGPTVYNLIHIGNLRAALVADLAYKVFVRAGYDVNYVRNYTDVDDKIIKKAAEEGMDSTALARKYTQEVEKDYALAGMSNPTHKPLATEHVPQMLTIIQKLIDNGTAYVSGGDVFYSIEKFKTYGQLSGKPLDDLMAGARVEVNEAKRNALDFALWKGAKPGEPSWDSPWGKGRPGWHIECSAMSTRWIGDEIDVHHGGEDLIFPHHENEIAQSEAASGHHPFVRYWVHHKHINVNKEKMSKSLGNFLLARDFLAKYGGEVARYMMLSVHYRSIIEFTDESVDGSLQNLQRIYEAKAAAKAILSRKFGGVDPMAESAWGEFAADCAKTAAEIDACYYNDFNTAGALGALFTLIRHFNRLVSDPKKMSTPAAALGAGEFVRVIEDGIGSVIGAGRQDPEKFLAELASIRAARTGASSGGAPTAEEIESLIASRKAARAAKNFAESDRIRDDLLARGVVLKDGPQGTTWSYK